MELKFYYCEDCDNLVILLKDSGVPMMCCGQPMIELSPVSFGASPKKHLPVCRREGNRVAVTVGSEPHQSEQEHFIEWIVLKSGRSFQRVDFSPGQPPEAVFLLSEGEEPEAVYAYCNQHGLWKG